MTETARPRLRAGNAAVPGREALSAGSTGSAAHQRRGPGRCRPLWCKESQLQDTAQSPAERPPGSPAPQRRTLAADTQADRPRLRPRPRHLDTAWRPRAPPAHHSEDGSRLAGGGHQVLEENLVFGRVRPPQLRQRQVHHLELAALREQVGDHQQLGTGQSPALSTAQGGGCRAPPSPDHAGRSANTEAPDAGQVRSPRAARAPRAAERPRQAQARPAGNAPWPLLPRTSPSAGPLDLRTLRTEGLFQTQMPRQ